MTAKAKINLKEGFIELEGTEEFVSKYLDQFNESLKLLKESARLLPAAKEHASLPLPEKIQSKKNIGGKKGRGGSKNIEPKKFDVHKNTNKPSLEDFVNEKNPSNNGDLIAVIGYYLQTYLGEKSFSLGHVEFGYKMLKKSRPKALYQIMINTKNDRDIYEPTEEDGLWRMTRGGDIWVSEKLPQKPGS